MIRLYAGIVLTTLLCILSPKVSKAQEVSALTLQECLDIAMDNNLDLQSSQLELTSGEANLLQNQGQRLPSFSAGASSGFRWGRSINPVTNLFETNRIGNINLSANSNLPLFNGFQINNSIRQAKADIEASRLVVEVTENDIMLNVINLFIDVVFAKEQVKIAKNQLNTNEEQLVLTTRMVEAGSLPLADQLDMEAQFTSSEVEVINAENNLRMAKLNLSQAMQIPFDPTLDVDVPELNAEDYPLLAPASQEIYQVAAENLPQIQAAEYRLQSAEYGVKIAKGAFLPSLGLSANVFSNYIDQVQMGNTEITPFMSQIENNLSQSANIGLNIPIFSNFSNRAGLQRARVQRQLSQVQMAQQKNQLRMEVETAYNEALAARQTYYATLRRVNSLEESFRMAQQRFNVGAINSVDYQVAQNNLFNAQSELLNAKYSYIFRVKVLDFYLGNPIVL